MNGTTADLAAESIADKALINQFNRITELSEENKSVVSKLIDAFLFQKEIKQKLAQLKSRTDAALVIIAIVAVYCCLLPE